MRGGTLIVAAAHVPADETDLLALADGLRPVDVDDIRIGRARFTHPRADVWYKSALEAMTYRPHISRSAFAGSASLLLSRLAI